jgi:hypothetical protein
MFNWLVEGWLSVYLFLAVVALVLLAVWWSTRQRKYLIAAAVVFALAALYGLLDLAVETDHEQMVRSVREMAASARNKDASGLFDHISDEFRHEGMTKSDLITLAKNAIEHGDVREVVVWDFERGPVSRADRSGTVIFLIKIKSPWTRDELFLRCKAHFVLESDGKWRLKGFELFDPARNNEPFHFGAIIAAIPSHASAPARPRASG